VAKRFPRGQLGIWSGLPLSSQIGYGSKIEFRAFQTAKNENASEELYRTVTTGYLIWDKLGQKPGRGIHLSPYVMWA